MKIWQKEKKVIICRLCKNINLIYRYYNSVNAQKDDYFVEHKSPKSKQRSSGFTALTKGRITTSGLSERQKSVKKKGCVSQCCTVF